jgi:hypothetical protein
LKLGTFSILASLALGTLGPIQSHAAPGGTGSFAYAVTPELFDATAIPKDKDQLKEVQMRSGMGLSLENPLVNVAVNYRLQGVIKGTDQSDLTDVLSTRFKSSLLNKLLQVDATVVADRTGSPGSDAYRYQLAPRITKSLNSMARLDLRYRHLIDKPASSDKSTTTRDYMLDVHGALSPNLQWRSSSFVKYHETLGQDHRTEGFAVNLNGKAQAGRLTWNSTYRATDISALDGTDETLELSQAVIDFQTRYAVNKDLKLELGSEIKQETRTEMRSERHLRAGVSWSPVSRYDLGFKIHRVESQYGSEDVYGSGNITWTPERHMRFSLGYGHKAVNGQAGIQLSTRLELGKT